MAKVAGRPRARPWFSILRTGSNPAPAGPCYPLSGNAKEMTSFGWGGDSRIVVT